MSKLFNSVLVRYTTLILTICPLAASAQEAAVDDIGIDDELALLAEEDMVLAAAKHKQKIGFSPSAVIVITRKDIEESGATCFIDLLRLYPAARVDTTLPSHRSIDIRGDNQVLLLLDGREVNLEFFPSPFYEAIPVGINEMERIEIVLGPNSALYGANAVAAVISITTRRLRKEFHTDLSVTYRVNLGVPRLIMSVSLFNPLGASFRDKSAARAPADGSNFGAEPQGPHALLTARLVY